MIIANISLPLEGIALERAFREVSEMDVEAERVAAHSTKWVMPCLWVSAPDFDAVDAALSEDPTVSAIVGADEFDDQKYYEIEWSDDVTRQVDAFLDRDGSILHARASADGWRIRIRFGSRDRFQAFRDRARDRDLSFDLRSLSEPGSPRRASGGVTPDQRDALVLAVERGYYAVPREATTRDLADELGKSHQAVSELLRRGVTNLVESSLVTDGPIDS